MRGHIKIDMAVGESVQLYDYDNSRIENDWLINIPVVKLNTLTSVCLKLC